jgi:hypothetical protein
MVDAFNPYIAFLKVETGADKQIVTRIVKFFLDDVSNWFVVAKENGIPDYYVEQMHDRIS